MAQAAGQHQWYLDILLEDLGAWDTALTYLQDLPRQEAAAALQKYGKVRPALCEWRLCRRGEHRDELHQWSAHRSWRRCRASEEVV